MFDNDPLSIVQFAPISQLSSINTYPIWGYLKFLELLGYDKYIVYFPLLKSREKLQQQDFIWKKICKDLKWQYIPSV